MNDAKQMQKLFILHLLDELNPEQEKELWEWRAISPENETRFQELADRNKFRAGLRRMRDSEATVWKKIQEKYPMDMTIPLERHWFTRINGKIAAMVAAVIALVTIIFLIWYDARKILPGRQQAFFLDARGKMFNSDFMKPGILVQHPEIQLMGDADGGKVLVARNHFLAPDSATQKLMTPRGSQFALRLPGIMDAWLNAESEFEFPANFNRKLIEIQLSGESYISMSEQNSQTVIFSAGNLRLQAVQARFNLQSYP
ncbi:MAG: hypothetical protein ACHQEM_11855, partial [Chitinophagales bacterium]